MTDVLFILKIYWYTEFVVPEYTILMLNQKDTQKSAETEQKQAIFGI